MRSNAPSYGGAWSKNRRDWIRGVLAEQRLILLIQKFVSDYYVVLHVEKAHEELDARGIDVVITLLDYGGRIVQIPIQVKSSFYYKMRFIGRYPNFIKNGGIVVVVNDSRSDRCICNELRVKIASVLKHKLAHISQLLPERLDRIYVPKETKRNILPFDRVESLQKKFAMKLKQNKRNLYRLNVANKEAEEALKEAKRNFSM